MGHHQEHTLVQYTPEQMFDLVADVESYPKFIPWIDALRVREEEGTRAQGRLVADMVVKYSMFRESFRSVVMLNREEGEIDVDYVKGPLKALTNNWVFEEDPRGCVINFSIDFEFKNRLMQTVANQLIDKAFTRLSGAFIEEAHRRYGKIIEKQQEQT